LIDELGIARCGLVGHSMGGGVAVLVAAARPEIASLVVSAEGVLDAEDDEASEAQSEAGYVQRGFPELLDAQQREALEAPRGLRAAHLGMTRGIEPRALYREEASMRDGTDPSIRIVLAGLTMPRWYLVGELSDPANLRDELAAIGVGWKVVPQAGHPMGLQNPAG